MKTKRYDGTTEDMTVDEIRALGPLMESTLVEVSAGAGDAKKWVPATRFATHTVTYNPGGKSVSIVME